MYRAFCLYHVPSVQQSAPHKPPAKVLNSPHVAAPKFPSAPSSRPARRPPPYSTSPEPQQRSYRFRHPLAQGASSARLAPYHGRSQTGFVSALPLIQRAGQPPSSAVKQWIWQRRARSFYGVDPAQAPAPTGSRVTHHKQAACAFCASGQAPIPHQVHEAQTLPRPTRASSHASYAPRPTIPVMTVYRSLRYVSTC